MKKNQIYKFLLSVCLMLSTLANAGEPLWEFTPLTPTKVTIFSHELVTVKYVVTWAYPSTREFTLVMTPIPGIISQKTPLADCSAFGLKQPCLLLDLTIIGSALTKNIEGGPSLCQRGNPNQCYQPDSNNVLKIKRVSPQNDKATIRVSPTSLIVTENSIVEFLVTNEPGSQAAANNIVATTTLGSNLSVQSTTCGAVLAIGASCTIRFATSTQEGPTKISLAGINTNIVTVSLQVVSEPQISITAPVQQDRLVTVSGLSLTLQITNAASSLINANAITVTVKTGCPNLIVDASSCTSVAPGASCLLDLSSNTPYAPCLITISGSNTANSPTTLIAFEYLGGLVFEESSGSGKIVTNLSQQFISPWTTNNANTGAINPNNGLPNTNAITADPSCLINPVNCAAQRCRNLDPSLYLPANNEIISIANSLCSNLALPCNFGGLAGAYWSSTQSDTNNAYQITFPGGGTSGAFKAFATPVRCVKTF
ncbi:MAG: DUF1566 domain-containing protein [Tatlockia sp.]|nr:DUF1566 domain-containing protein [Tatlockia sp.]